ncbi:spore wall protein 2-like [Brassica napus]|uniref:spore wall protein 2-like n=1 Tax=Brassica napus TaxID=3708 RepID=UPI00207AB7E4|nr:spore wall protein 2-like [Brassica napus]
MRTVSEERDEDHVGDEAEEGDEADVRDEDEEGQEAEEGDESEEGHEAEDHDGEEDADIPVVADAEDYSEYGKVKDEDEEEDDEIFFDDYKGAYGCEGEGSSVDRIYVNKSFASKDALLSELRLTAVRQHCYMRKKW